MRGSILARKSINKPELYLVCERESVGHKRWTCTHFGPAIRTKIYSQEQSEQVYELF